MSRGNWSRIKQSKYFYVIVYRKLLSVIIISIAFNVILCTAIMFTYFNRPIREYYATSGITPPIQLKGLQQPNYLSEALLTPDVKSDDDYRAIPE